MENVLFTRQTHIADKAGKHYDYRIVVGGIAHSWATKKELPEEGKPIMLWEQPVHTASYALSDNIVIPKGQYGAGVTTLDSVQKGKAEFSDDKIVVHTRDAKYLLKKMPNYQDGSGWLFRKLPKEEKTINPYLTKIAEAMTQEAITSKINQNPGNLGKVIGQSVKSQLPKAAPTPRIATIPKVTPLTKLAMLIQKYKCSETGKEIWHQEGTPKPGKGWELVKGQGKYIKRGQSKYLSKIADVMERDPLVFTKGLSKAPPFRVGDHC